MLGTPASNCSKYKQTKFDTYVLIGVCHQPDVKLGFDRVSHWKTSWKLLNLVSFQTAVLSETQPFQFIPLFGQISTENLKKISYLR